MREIGDSFRVEDSVLAARPGGAAGLKTSLIEPVGDLGVDVVVQESIDELDELCRCLDELGRGLWVFRRICG